MKYQKLLLGTFCLLGTLARAENFPRPTQYVVMAFDGSKDVGMWKETRAFATQEKINFTYFISGVYWLANSNSKLYKHPDGGAKSCIGFGGVPADVKLRVDQVNLAFEEKNEIASHANGHCHGATSWSRDKWDSEFSQFNTFIFDTFKINNIAGAYKFSVKDIVGFRAPFLDTSKAMWTTLGEHKYRYDTSLTGSPNYWPKKIQKTWNFPLGEIKIAGTGKRTLSMDYNFYVADSKGNPDPKNSEVYHQRMFQSYLNYFNGNYYGNRAPIHIGHHFSKWNDAAYWKALKSFAKAVCKMSEVKCVTYDELADRMDGMSDQMIAAYQAGNFPRMTRPSQNNELFAHGFKNIEALDLNLALEAKSDEILVRASGIDAHVPATLTVELDGKVIASNRWTLSQAEIAGAVKSTGSELSAVLRNQRGLEIQRITKNIYRDLSPSGVFLGDEDLENRNLKGDMIEAHLED